MIKFFVMDVDGTLTDGKIYMGNDDELFKVFNIKDGCGIHDILPIYKIVPIIITGRKSKIVQNRCNELGISEIYQNVRNKYAKLSEILQEWTQRDKKEYGLSDCAYIGDDILDVQCMQPIKEAGGLVGCPRDAVREIRDLSDFISSKDGGNGAVRDFIDWIIKNEQA